jgi:general secretion pathway protein A
MEYYNILNLKKEPFSNSPEPEFFFESPKHMGCLQKLELAIRLRRGLNVVIGDIGTGKTTLCRKLIQQLSYASDDSQDVETHLLLDPSFKNSIEFLQTVCLQFGIKEVENQESEWQLKESIKNYLFSKGVDEEKIIVLIIDEGQKFPEDCLEILREFLNYETNNFKLLQIIIFAQNEFKKILDKRSNLSDRINTLYYLQPLNFQQTRAMINYRISVARDLEKAPALFSFWALLAVYRATNGYPRRVVSLCHQVILALIIRGRKKAGFFLVRSCHSALFARSFKKIKWAAVSLLILIAVSILITAAILQYKNVNAYIQAIIFKNNSESIEKTNPVQANSILPAPVSTENVTTLVIPNLAILRVDNVDNNVNDIKMPEYMGRLRIEQGETLTNILQNIYGNSGIKITRALILANQQIHGSGKIIAGSILNFPSIPADVKTINGKCYFIQIENGKDMGDIYRFFLENSRKQKIPQSVFFPYWNEKEGMVFMIVVDKCFDNPQSAQEKISKLPAAIRTKTKIISGWDTNTIVFNSHVFKRNE